MRRRALDAAWPVGCSRPVPPFCYEVSILHMHWKHWMRCGSYRPRVSKCPIYVSKRCGNWGGLITMDQMNCMGKYRSCLRHFSRLGSLPFNSLDSDLLKSPVTGRGQCLPSQCSGWSMRQGRPWRFFLTPVKKILYPAPPGVVKTL